MINENPYLPITQAAPDPIARCNKCWLLHECAFWLAGLLTAIQLAFQAYLVYTHASTSSPPPLKTQLLGLFVVAGIGGLIYFATKWYFKRGKRELIGLGLVVVAIFVAPSILG